MRPLEARFSDVYRDVDRGARWSDPSFEGQIQRLLAIYANDHQILVESILADDAHAVVLTSESRGGAIQPKAWRAAHVWRYSHDRVTSLDVYVLTLSVAIPA